MMMAIRFAVGRDVDQLIPMALVGEGAQQAPGKPLAAFEQMLERDRSGYRCIVEEQADFPPGRKSAEISARGINATAVDILPRFFCGQLAHAFRLKRRE